MLDQREAPIVGVEDQPVGQKRPSHIAAFNVGGLNLSPASNDEDFDVNIDAIPVNSPAADLFADGGFGKKTATQKATEFTDEMGMAPDVKLGNGGGSLGQLSLREIEERKREKAEEDIEDFLERAEEHEKEVKAAQAKWDAEMHNYGGEQLSGAEIMRRIEWFEKKENQDKVREELRKQGKTEQEVEETIRKMKERDELLKRQRNGEKLSPEETNRLNGLNTDPQVVFGGSISANVLKEDAIQNKKVNAAVSKAATLSEGLALQEKQVTNGGLSAADLKRLEQLNKDPSVQRIGSMLDDLDKQRKGVPKVASNDGSDLQQKQTGSSLSEADLRRLNELNRDASVQRIGSLHNAGDKLVAASSGEVEVKSEARQNFPTAAAAKQDFTVAATGAPPTSTAILDGPKVDAKVAQAAEPPKITTAKIDAAAAAFM